MTVFRALSLAVLLAAAVAAPAAAAARIEIVNADFESGKPGNDGPHGWSTAQHTGPLSYDFALDSGEKKSGTQSLRVTNIGPEPFGSLIQSIPAAGLGGKKLRLTAWVKVSGIPEEGKRTGAVLSLTALRGSAVLASEAMRRRELRGSADWTRHSIELAIPAGAARIDFGAVLQGTGKMWVDDFTLETVEP